MPLINRTGALFLRAMGRVAPCYDEHVDPARSSSPREVCTRSSCKVGYTEIGVVRPVRAKVDQVRIEFSTSRR